MLGKFDQQAVAFDMGLLSEKINQSVFAEGYFIDAGGDVAQFTFRADFAEINGKDPQKLFDQVLGRRDICVEKP